MFSFLRRHSAAPASDWMATRGNVGERVDAGSPENYARLKQFACDFVVSGSYVEPDGDEHELWRAGKLVPWYISHLLDNGRHFGSGVDIACHAEEPAVDLWEAGRLCPSWDQTVALARLLDVRVRDLTHPDARPHHHEDRPRYRVRDNAILSFEPSVLQAAASSTT